MAGEETLQKREEGSDSEDEEDDDLVEDVPKVEIGLENLTPLSPEVISKQVCYQDPTIMIGFEF